MKLSWLGGVVAVCGLLATSAVAAPGPNCTATCNTANAQCRQAGKNDTACLYAWHQCKAGCAAPAAPAKLQVTRPAPNTVVIKTTPAPTKH